MVGGAGGDGLVRMIDVQTGTVSETINAAPLAETAPAADEQGLAAVDNALHGFGNLNMA